VHRARGNPVNDLEAREAELISRHDAEWTSELRTIASAWCIDRGFVVSVTARIPSFVSGAAKLETIAPLLCELVVDAGVPQVPDRQLEALANCPQLARLTSIDFTDGHSPSSSRAFKRLLASPHLGILKRLRLGCHSRGQGIGSSGTRAIAQCERLSHLEALHLCGQNLGEQGALVLAEAPNLRALEVLRLPRNRIPDRGVAALLASKNLPRLRRLELSDDVDAELTQPLRIARNRISAKMTRRLRSRGWQD
jgi:hypothetical protein